MNSDIQAHPAQAVLDRSLVPERIRPLARTSFYVMRGTRARVLARVRRTSARNVSAPIFIIGCGRSGTTLLGEMIAKHPAVSYRYEPYDLWAAVESATDFLQLYSSGEHHCLIDASSVTALAQRRFRRLMSIPRGSTLVEKNPINALRIGYLNALAPEARFVHIARDGVDVAGSIERIAAVTKRMTFRLPLNAWWGVGDTKWTALERDGKEAGYYPDDVGHLTTDAQRGAYEWLLSLREAEAWRAFLGSRLIDLRYQDLASDPCQTLRGVMDSLGLSCPDWWLAQASALVIPVDARPRQPLVLPAQMSTDFNRLQERFEFEGRVTGETSYGTASE